MRNLRLLASVASLGLLLSACGGGDSFEPQGTGGQAEGGGSTGTTTTTGHGGSGGATGSGGAGGTTGSGGNTGGTGGTTGSGGNTGGTGGSAIVDVDGDGYASDVDCNDGDPDIHPGANEKCNGVDDDCDGVIDNGVTGTLYLDADQDGYGVDAAATNIQGCGAQAGYSATAGDCDDANPSVNPGATEACNGVDDNCDGQVDEGVTKTTYYPDADGDGYGVDAGSVQTCTAPSGNFVTLNGDCDDTDKDRFPGNPEVCDGKDNDCDAATADPGVTDWYKDADGDGYGDLAQKQSSCAQPAGYVGNAQDCDDGNKNINPAAIEICDGVDNNCVGGVDEGPIATYPDVDGDGYGDASAQPTYRCAADAAHVADNTDCNDNDKKINPAAIEIPGNGIDENCDGGDSALGTQCEPQASGISTIPYTINASLVATDNKPGNPRGAYMWDEYELASEAGKPFTILMSGSRIKAIDSHLYASANSCFVGANLENATWASNHPKDPNNRARIVVPAPATGFYDIAAAEDTATKGNYVLSVLPGQLGRTCGADDQAVWPLGWRQDGSLDTGDKTPNGPIALGDRADDFEVWFDANQPYTVLHYPVTYSGARVSISSGADCKTEVASAKNTAYNRGLNLVYTPTKAGIYAVWPSNTTAGVEGSYNINVVPGNVGESCFKGAGGTAGTGDALAFWPINRAAMVETLTIGDRVDPWLGNRYFDDFETWLEANEEVTLTVTSSAFTPWILVTSASACSTVLWSEKPTSGNKATVTFKPTTSGIYTIIATSNALSAAGNYSVSGTYN
jgi:hypothetical protein